MRIAEKRIGISVALYTIRMQRYDSVERETITMNQSADRRVSHRKQEKEISYDLDIRKSA